MGDTGGSAKAGAAGDTALNAFKNLTEGAKSGLGASSDLFRQFIGDGTPTPMQSTSLGTRPQFETAMGAPTPKTFNIGQVIGNRFGGAVAGSMGPVGDIMGALMNNQGKSTPNKAILGGGMQINEQKGSSVVPAVVNAVLNYFTGGVLRLNPSQPLTDAYGTNLGSPGPTGG